LSVVAIAVKKDVISVGRAISHTGSFNMEFSVKCRYTLTILKVIIMGHSFGGIMW
jgi:hypothetical protein